MRNRRLELDSLTGIHWLAILAAIVSGLVHLVLGVGFLPHWMGALFLLAAVGFAAGIGLVLIDYRRRLVYLVGIPFVGGQVVLWYALNQPSSIGDLGVAEVVDKLAQAVLIVALSVLYRWEP
ncbi:DUF7475 family protein [Natronobacterium gregoryi]|nr:hypothetical protein [Natronobacterium gregoryi]ELY72119.1 hypothetical protein C490_04167 [Natronobacterium gregoryi SP2]PLK19750.1 hypothetical protein CYV19_13165 [Natronobacterium gregoryi SP2]